MHIGIDARIYGIYHRGIGRYTEQLILNLGEIKDNNRYTLFMRHQDARNIRLKEGKFKVVEAEIPHYSVKEHILMPRLIKEARVDAMHFPHLNVPFICPVPYVMTIHDLIVYHFPDTRASDLPKWKYRIKVWGYNKVLKNALRRAQKVITVSEFTKRDIMRNFGILENKIEVIYLGSEEMFFGVERRRNTEQFSNYLFDKYGISKQYILYVGSAYPHKNLYRLIEAHKILKNKYLRDWQLILVGRIDSFYKKLQQNVSDKSVIFTGEVSQRDLDGLYRDAKLFVFPSLYEGFGLPVLEAESRGTPVVSSSAASLPEILSDSAEYFDPKDKESIAKKIDLVGGSRKMQEEMSQKGFERSKHFSWRKTAFQTIDEYKSIMV